MKRNNIGNACTLLRTEKFHPIINAGNQLILVFLLIQILVNLRFSCISLHILHENFTYSC